MKEKPRRLRRWINRPASAVGSLPPTALVRTYVWEKPVRISHWLIVASLLFLSFTGIYIHHPFRLASGEPVFDMARMRFVHEVAGFVLIGALALRIYWFFKGNLFSRWSAYLPIRREQWSGMGSMLEFYLFLRFLPGRRAGHNPLAALTYFIIYLLLLVEVLTGLALYAHVTGNATLTYFFGWLPHLVNISYLRLVHYLLMFVFFAFTIFHVYASVLVSLEEENGLLDSIFSGWKFMPAGDLRAELAAIPEARTFVRRHQLLPRAPAAEQAAGRAVRRPGPGPRVLFRNWLSYIGTGIAAVGLLVFTLLTLYHTVGGGSLAQPYGALVIFFVPPIFVIIGVALILAGMYLQWLRWRQRKPLSFGRYPKWDLNVAAERRALLAVTIGAAVFAVPAIYGSYRAYGYTESVSFCGAVCHSMTPQYVTYQHSPHARVPCAQCHVGPGATGYIESKVRGLVELKHTIMNTYPRPIPVPVTALRPIRGNCEKCHWPENFFGSHEVRMQHFLADEKNTPWDIDMLVHIGGPSRIDPRRRATIHWHISTKVEYVASDPARQQIPWVRAVDPKTGMAKVYSSQSQPTASPPSGEVRTMDCVDCHNRPSHILPSPDHSVDLALADGRIDRSLPYIKQQSVAALAGTHSTREQALQTIDNAIHLYYQKTYPAIYASKQTEINSAVQALHEIYNRSFFPEMKVRWDTYYENDGHFHFSGCYRCHDGQHKSVEGSVIRNDCNLCHIILQQGSPGAMKVATGPEGLPFEHPVDIGTAWAESPCSSCHTGGPM